MRKDPIETKKHSVAIRDAAVPAVERSVIESIEPTRRGGPFVSFQYSYAEVSSQGGRTRVKTRKSRLEGGEVTTETFEGELDAGIYEQVVGSLERQMLDQATMMMRSLSWFLPSIRSPRSGRN